MTEQNRLKTKSREQHPPEESSAEDILGLLVHQCSQPLSNLSLIIDDLDDASSYGELDEAYLKESVSEAHRQIEFLADTIANFRSLANPVAESAAVFDPRQAVVDVVRVMAPQLRSRNINLGITCECAERSLIHDGTDAIHACTAMETDIPGSATEFRQVILNLIANARDELAECLSLGLIAPGHAEIDVRLSATNDTVTVHVVDNGRGINESTITRIFDRGFTTKPRAGSTGFGLHLVQVVIADRLGGTVSVSNDTGAHFTLTIPRPVNP